MKTWTMPRIGIDQFSANDYIAKCSTVRPEIPGTSLYVDWDGNGAYSSAERVWGTYGDSNEGYNGAQSSGVHGLKQVHVYGINPIFTTKKKPGWTQVNASMDSPYLNTPGEALDNNGNWVRGNMWVDLGVYDVYYISSSGVYIYGLGNAPSGGTPSDTVSRS